MLARLNKTGRVKAGRLLALVYLLCVVAPGLSFALGDGSRAAPCLLDEHYVMGIAHLHDAGAPVVQHVHADGQMHEHAAPHARSGTAVGHADMKPAAEPALTPVGDEHKAAGAQCCGMVCMSALPAPLVEVVRPSVPTSRCANEIYRGVAENTPPTHYRPPIS